VLDQGDPPNVPLPTVEDDGDASLHFSPSPGAVVARSCSSGGLLQ
jgi:hypothetical protein